MGCSDNEPAPRSCRAGAEFFGGMACSGLGRTSAISFGQREDGLRKTVVHVAALALALAVPFTPASAAPLQPTGKWHLFYQEAHCAAERQFGDHALGFQPSPLGKTMRVVIVGPGRIMRTRQLDSLIELSDGGPAIKTSSLVYGTSKKGQRGITTVLPLDQAERLSKSTWLRVSTLGTGPKSKRTMPAAEPFFTAEFAIGSTAALSRELGKCLADLQKHWGMINGELPKPAVPPVFPLRGLIRSEDYPEDAFNANQGGTTRYMLMIDDNGKLLDCIVQETSGVASIDQMGCQVIKERGKGKPALDAGGKPMKSIIEGRISWRIE